MARRLLAHAVDADMAGLDQRGGAGAGLHHPRMPQPFIETLALQAPRQSLLTRLANRATSLERLVLAAGELLLQRRQFCERRIRIDRPIALARGCAGGILPVRRPAVALVAAALVAPPKSRPPCRARPCRDRPCSGRPGICLAARRCPCLRNARAADGPVFARRRALGGRARPRRRPARPRGVCGNPDGGAPRRCCSRFGAASPPSPAAAGCAPSCARGMLAATMAVAIVARRATFLGTAAGTPDFDQFRLGRRFAARLRHRPPQLRCRRAASADAASPLTGGVCRGLNDELASCGGSFERGTVGDSARPAPRRLPARPRFRRGLGGRQLRHAGARARLRGNSATDGAAIAGIRQFGARLLAAGVIRRWLPR